MCRVRRLEIVNFMPPPPPMENNFGVQSFTVMHFFQFCSLLLSLDHTNWVYNNNDQERVYQNSKFYDPRGMVCCAREWTNKSYSKNALFFKKKSSLLLSINRNSWFQDPFAEGYNYVCVSMYSTLIVIVLTLLVFVIKRIALFCQEYF